MMKRRTEFGLENAIHSGMVRMTFSLLTVPAEVLFPYVKPFAPHHSSDGARKIAVINRPRILRKSK